MTKIFKLELKRAMLNKNMLISLIIGLILSLAGIFVFKYGNYANPDAYGAWLSAIGGGTGIYIMFFPLLASLPYGHSYSVEKYNNLTPYIFTRIDKNKYLNSKLLANGIAGGLVIFIHCLITFIVSLILMYNLPLDTETNLNDPISRIHNSNPTMYISFYILWMFLQGFVYSTLSFSCSLIFEKKFIALVIPFLYFHIANFGFAILGFSLLTPPTSVAPYNMDQADILSMIFQPILLLIISTLLITISKRKD